MATGSLFDNVTMGVDEGDKLGLIGVNGAGKSTFLRVVAGFEPADDGRITLGGGVRIGYLSQNPRNSTDCGYSLRTGFQRQFAANEIDQGLRNGVWPRPKAGLAAANGRKN